MSRSVHDPLVRRALARIRNDGILHPANAILASVQEPRWDRPLLAHDWRRHVPAGLRDVWDTLPLHTRLCVYESAEFSALDEDAGTAMVTGPAAEER